MQLSVRTGPFRSRWLVEHQGYIHNEQFQDVLLRGPFATYTHTHTFTPDGPKASTLTDSIEYALPLGVPGAAVAGRYARNTFKRVFQYRHALMSGDLVRHAQYRSHKRLRIAITGATGGIGSQLAVFLSTGGHTVVRLIRATPADDSTDIQWDPMADVLNADALEGFDAIIHLAGAPIAARWSEAHKRSIRESRVRSTTLLANTIARLSQKPSVLLSASAVGVYGNRGDAMLNEKHESGSDWLAQVAADWENATRAAEQAGVRVVHLRTGIVLNASSGMLGKVAPVFRMGAGGQLGNGTQWLSPISLNDAIGAIHHCLMNERVSGAVNITAPEQLMNRDFTRLLARVLQRPAIAPVPAWILRTLFGEMADATVLTSQRAVPEVLLDSGFTFQQPTVEEMLRFELGLM